MTNFIHSFVHDPHSIINDEETILPRFSSTVNATIKWMVEFAPTDPLHIPPPVSIFLTHIHQPPPFILSIFQVNHTSTVIPPFLWPSLSHIYIGRLFSFSRYFKMIIRAHFSPSLAPSLSHIHYMQYIYTLYAIYSYKVCKCM